MSLLSLRAPRRVLTAAAAGTLLVGAPLIVLGPASPAVADYGVTITSSSPLKVPANMANRVVVITGTNFDEDQIVSIKLGSDPDCAAITSYVVTSSTTISVKTPGNGTDTATVPGCAPSPNPAVGEDITINQTGAGNPTVTKPGSASAGIIFVPPPSIDAVAANPVITDNSSALDTADQVKALSTAGGQLLRIRSGASFAFDGRATAGLSGTYGGKPLTTVGFQATDGSAQAANAAPGAVGNNYWLARTATALPATATPVLTITQGTVARTFETAATGTTIVATPTVTGLDVTSGKTGAATTVKITGTNFSTTPGDLTVTMCGVTAEIVGATTLTSITVQTPNPGSTPATTTAALKTAIGGTAGVCPVVVTKGGVASPITAASFFAFLDR